MQCRPRPTFVRTPGALDVCRKPVAAAPRRIDERNRVTIDHSIDRSSVDDDLMDVSFFHSTIIAPLRGHRILNDDVTTDVT